MVVMPDPFIDKNLIIGFIVRVLRNAFFNIYKMTNVEKFLTSFPNHRDKMNLFRHGITTVLWIKPWYYGKNYGTIV